jgi:hypothetical protein
MFLCSTASTLALRPTHTPIQWVQGEKRRGRDADYPPPSSAEVKNGGTIPPLTIRIHGLELNQLSTGTTLPFYIILH